MTAITLASLILFSPELGAEWHYERTVRLQNSVEEIDMTEIENIVFRIAEVSDNRANLTVTSKLVKSILDGNEVPAENNPGIQKTWTLFPNFGCAFAPLQDNSLEERVARIWRSWMPLPTERESIASGEQVRDYAALDKLGVPESAVAWKVTKRFRDEATLSMSYREPKLADATDGSATAVLVGPARMPKSLSIRFGNVRIPGGVVNAVATIEYRLIKTIKPRATKPLTVFDD